MTEHKCVYCKHDFGTSRGLEKHKLRQTGCISWKEMDDMFGRLNTSKQAIHAQFNKSIINFQEEIKRYQSMMQAQKEQISNLMAEKLLNDEKYFKWEKISVIAPFLTTGTKKQIKSIIEDIKDQDQIKQKIASNYPKFKVAQITCRKKEIEILLEDEELTECKICFEAKAQSKGKCKVCKVCYVCVDCEIDQMTKFKKCAFCNTYF